MKEAQQEIKKKGGYTYFSINEEDLISFSSISNSKIIFCNEPGYFTIYHSDRNGFNNPDNVWAEEQLDIVMLGDSYVHGACVNQGDDMAAQVRSLSKLNTY